MRPIAKLTRVGAGKAFTVTRQAAGEVGDWGEALPFRSTDFLRGGSLLDGGFESYVEGAYKSNGIVFACILARLLVFSEARFQFQRFSDGRPGDLFGNPSLSILERPWPNGTTGELLARMEQDASLAGNFFATKVKDLAGERIRRLRPDWTTIVTGSKSDNVYDLDARVVGYIYSPPGLEPITLTPREVVHWSPIPDPNAQWRGMSWLQPVVREIRSDSAATDHKFKYFKHGATGGIVVKYDKSTPRESIEAFADKWKDTHEGVDNAYKTYHLGGGADITTVGADLKELDFKSTQGAGETRIAAAAGVGAVIAQISEGLQGSALNAGNFQAAKRRFADGTIRPNWRSASAALETFVRPLPPGAGRLWYDPRDVPFLKDDTKDEAEIQQVQATAIKSLVDAGFDADAAVQAVTSGDLRILNGKHSGLFSVQLQPPSDGTQPALPVGS